MGNLGDHTPLRRKTPELRKAGKGSNEGMGYKKRVEKIDVNGSLPIYPQGETPVDRMYPYKV